ncbi:MAG TPA: SDR family NAD(P)-dependent oxidoreductase [Stellaceae bacterium]|nr:SDR family NAD(P)-dependent oxidoreductase [Stellaceae bacterium]
MKLGSDIAAVVTGGASGLGAATARALAAKGVRIGIFDVDAAKGQALADELGGAFARVDVTSDEQVEAGFARLRGLNGQERILINCAGIADAIKTAGRDRKTGEIRMHPMGRFIRVIEVNLIGAFRCIAHSSAGMMTLPTRDDGERGAIVNTASIAAEDGQMGQVAYSASKGGIVGMTLPIARDFNAEGIRVNTILPGIFETPLMLAAPANVLEALAASVPFPKRLGKPEEYAHLAVAMIENAYLNGEDVRLDGAIRMGLR